MKPRKYNYYKIIQLDYGYGQGFEDASHYPTNSSYIPADGKTLKADLKEYQLSKLGTCRVIKRRELIEEGQQ